MENWLKYHPTGVPDVSMTNGEFGREIMLRWSCDEIDSFLCGVRDELRRQMDADRNRGYVRLCALQSKMLDALELFRSVFSGKCIGSGIGGETGFIGSPYEAGVAVMCMRYDRIGPIWSGIWFGLRGRIICRGDRRLSDMRALVREIRRANYRMFLLCAPFMEHEFLRECGGKPLSLDDLRL